MKKPETVETKICKIIKKFVKKNYGESEASDPSWDIKELAKYLAEHLS